MPNRMLYCFVPGFKRRGSHIRRVAILALACCLPCAGKVFNGTFSGVVTDAHGALVAGALVHARNEATKSIFNASTDSSGVFRIKHVPSGTYMLEITAKGFKTLSVMNVAVFARCSDFRSISITTGEPSTRIERFDDGPLIDTRQCAVESTFAITRLASVDCVVENRVHRRSWIARTFAKVKRPLRRDPCPVSSITVVPQVPSA